MSDWRQPALATFAADIMAQSQRAQTITAGLSPAELIRPPAPARWSVAHCLEHLATTFAAYRPRLVQTIDRGIASPPATPPAYRPGRLARWFVQMVGPGGRKIAAPKVFRPPEKASPRAPELFAESQLALLELLRRADTVDLNRWKLRSPASALLRFRLGEAFELLLRHNDRHLDQAARTKVEVLGG